jgi:hypothetical protein
LNTKNLNKYKARIISIFRNYYGILKDLLNIQKYRIKTTNGIYKFSITHIEWYKKLQKINNEYQFASLKNKDASDGNKKLKIIFAQSFGIYSPCFIHDNLLALSLKLRGAEIIPVYCDSIQSVECNVFGGVWCGDNFKNNCRNCLNRSEKLWENYKQKIKLSSHLQDEDKIIVRSIIDNLEYDEWSKYIKNGLTYGEWAKDILVNNYVVADYYLIDNHEFLGKSHLENLLLLGLICERIIDTVKPDRVVSNDSYYGIWAIWENICKRKGIKFYSHWTGGRKQSWCYAYNDAAMNLNFKPVWQNFRKLELDEDKTRKIEKWVNERTKGLDMILDTSSAASYKTDNFDFSNFDSKKPTALLPANVIWDLAALNKQIIFKDMVEWIIKTIEWFSVNPDFQLIIKPHPAETHPTIPKTYETIEFVLNRHKIIIPKNVFLLSSNVKYTVYDLFPVVCVGLVHTSTVGLEMAAKGIQVITTARSPYRDFGFTYDPENENQYFLFLKRILSKSEKIDILNQKKEAYKFILFYFYHYYSNIGIMKIESDKEPILKINSIYDLMPGKNRIWDYFIESIIDGLPIITDKRWPLESD